MDEKEGWRRMGVWEKRNVGEEVVGADGREKEEAAGERQRI